MSQNSFLHLSATVVLLVGMINISNCQIPVRLTLIPSKWLLRFTDQSVLLNCNGMPNVNANTSVVFSLGNTVIYNSTNKLIEAGVSVQNYTTIRYNKISSGVVNATCKVNQTVSSNSATLAYISQLVFTPEPRNFNVSVPFLAKCAVSLAPNITSYTVNFYVNNTEIGRWTMAANYYPIFTRPTVLQSLDVLQGSAVSRTFSARITPKTIAARGKYYCRISVAVPQVVYSHDSNIWNTSSSARVVPSMFLLLIFVIFFAVNFDLSVIY